MKDSQVISWIFLAIAMASQKGASDIKGISIIADGINHAVPTQKELQMSIRFLTDKKLILQEGKK